MRKLCTNGDEIAKLSRSIEEMQATILSLQIENDSLRKEIEGAKKREEGLHEQVTEAKYAAGVAVRRSNDLDQYVRRNNCRVYGMPETGEGGGEDENCEEKVVKLFKDKMSLNIAEKDIEACHRLGKRKPGVNTPRGIIVRFVSRKDRDAVLYSRRKLAKSGKVIVEDLTPDNYALYCKVKEDPLCVQAWTKNGNVFMKTKSDRIVLVDSPSELNSPGKREFWSSSPKTWT
jgi:hypothetical protein